jgi:hypothetical protein
MKKWDFGSGFKIHQKAILKKQNQDQAKTEDSKEGRPVESGEGK